MSSTRPACLVCRAQCETAEELKKHVSHHVYNVPVFQCKDCKDTFSKKESFHLHRATAHGDKLEDQGKREPLEERLSTWEKKKRLKYSYRNTYICALCGRRFFNKDTCVGHILKHKNMAHECRKCKWTFTSPYCLQVHKAAWHRQRKKQKVVEFKAWHEKHDEQKENAGSKTLISGYKRFVCPSAACRIYIGSYEELLAHAAKAHGITAHRTCKECTRNFANTKMLEYHIENHDKMRYKCPVSICFCAFEKHAEMDNHYAAYHKGRDNVAFRKKMPTKTLTKGNKAQQSKAGRLEAERKCPMCGRVYQSDASLMEHVTNHVQMKYRCLYPSCGWEFEVFNSMCSHYYSRHEIKISKNGAHHFEIETSAVDDEERKLYRCSYTDCGYNVSGSFAQYEEVLAHQIADHGEEYHECTLCGRKLLEAEIDMHVGSHEKMKYKCLEDSCGWEFARFGTLFVHYFTCHKMTLTKDDEETFVIGTDSAESGASGAKLETKETPQSAKGYTCPYCNRQFTSETKFYTHIDNHSNMNYKCKCGWEFTDFRYLQIHYHDAHKNLLHLTRADEPWYRLQKVDAEARSTRRSTRNQGAQATKTDEAHQYKYPCPILLCTAGCDDFSQLERHLEVMHDSVTGYCPVCYRFLKERIKYRMHLERHMAGATWHRCLYDGWAYDGIKSLQMHFKHDHKWQEIPDESHYDIVPDAVFCDDESTSAYEDSDLEIISVEESVESKNEQKYKIKKEPEIEQTETNKHESNSHVQSKQTGGIKNECENDQTMTHSFDRNSRALSERKGSSVQKAEEIPSVATKQNTNSQCAGSVKRKSEKITPVATKHNTNSAGSVKRKAEEPQSVAKRRNTNIQCAFCNETFDIEHGMESHKCYQDIYAASTEIKVEAKVTDVHATTPEQTVMVVVGAASTSQAHPSKQNQQFDSSQDKKPVVNIGFGGGDSRQTLPGGHQTLQPQSQQGAGDAATPGVVNPSGQSVNSPRKYTVVCDDKLSLSLDARKALGLDIGDLQDIDLGLRVSSADSGISVTDFDPNASTFDWSEIERLIPTIPPIDGFPLGTGAASQTTNSSGTVAENKDNRCANDFLRNLFDDVIQSTYNDERLGAATANDKGKIQQNAAGGIRNEGVVSQTSVPSAPETAANGNLPNSVTKASPNKDTLCNIRGTGELSNQSSNLEIQPKRGPSQRHIRDNQNSQEYQITGNNNNNNSIKRRSEPEKAQLVNAHAVNGHPLNAHQNTASPPVNIDEPILIDDQDDEPPSIIIID